MSECFPEPKSLVAIVKVELDLYNYATKADLKNAAGVDISSFAKRTDLANLKSNLDKLGIDKLKNVPTNSSNLKSKVDKLIPVPVDLSKLSDAVKNDVVKKDVYHAKIKNIEDKIRDITNLATWATLNPKINEIKGEISNVTNLALNVSLNAKINDAKGEIANITNLATTNPFTAVKNKIPSVSNVVVKNWL